MTDVSAGQADRLPGAPPRPLAAVLDEAAAVRQQIDYQRAVHTTALRKGWGRLDHAARTNLLELRAQLQALDREAVTVAWVAEWSG